MKQSIFLTGSTSFLGSKFIELYSDKYNIVGTSKNDKTNPIDILEFPSLKELYLKTDPKVIIHTAAVVDQDADKVRISNVQGTANVIELAKIDNASIIFTSSESVYGGKEFEGNYGENDQYKPRSAYGETKVESEKLIINSGLNYLITRCHRFVGINKGFIKSKQFPDTLKAIISGDEVHLDNHRLFRPCLINNISDVFSHYIEHDLEKKLVMNLGVDKVVTYYDFIVDVANILGLNSELILPDGQEINWPENSTLCLDKVKSLGYPTQTYENLLQTIKSDYAMK